MKILTVEEVENRKKQVLNHFTGKPIPFNFKNLTRIFCPRISEEMFYF